MDPTQFMMAMLVFGDKGSGANVFKQMAPAMLPNLAGRVALIALAARKEQKQQDETHTQIIKEVVALGVRDIKTLKEKVPALHTVFVALPAALQDSIFPPPPPGSVRPADGSPKGERAAR